MALRNIMKHPTDDDVLRKKARNVIRINKNVCAILEAMSETSVNPDNVIVKAINEDGQKVEIKGEGLLARVFCHEIDHLDGTLFIDKAESGSLERIVKKDSEL